MSLDTVRKTFEKLGREDPLYGVLTDHKRRHNKWDPVEFFETGVAEVTRMMQAMAAIPLDAPRGDALDFGCGVGRLTLALGAHFERVVGIDIADTMIERAREYNTLGDRITYLVNTRDDLSLLPTASFDFVYSSIVLQHIPPESAKRYIAEFMRILRPGGVAAFHVPSGKPYAPGSLGAMWYRVRREYLRRAWKLIRGRAPYEMHYVPRTEVEAIVREGNAELVHRANVAAENFMYYVRKRG
ncbi:MAG: class I SAM-dependent methyltransferase [Gemmatimonadaceae bacterium]|nr:class I SAM-dependent methyltransferase [Gemmatimonadaceae bacterium]